MMSKGKKFTAAEKHFEKKRIEYDKTIKGLRARVNELIDENDTLKKDAAENADKIAKLELEVKHLRELAGMTPKEAEEFKKKLDSQSRVVETIEGLEKITGLFGRY